MRVFDKKEKKWTPNSKVNKMKYDWCFSTRHHSVSAQQFNTCNGWNRYNEQCAVCRSITDEIEYKVCLNLTENCFPGVGRETKRAWFHLTEWISLANSLRLAISIIGFVSRERFVLFSIKISWYADSALWHISRLLLNNMV